jgi:hypothetical protein
MSTIPLYNAPCPFHLPQSHHVHRHNTPYLMFYTNCLPTTFEHFWIGCYKENLNRITASEYLHLLFP